MAVSTEFENLADSQHKLEFSINDGTAWLKMPVLQQSDYPDQTRVFF